MSPDDFRALELSVQRAIANETCVPVMPGQLAELLRVYRAHESTTAAKPLEEP